MRIAITGSSGLVGTALHQALEAAGHTAIRLARTKPSADGVRWQLDSPCEFDAVVHLAGENVASGRWTAARKRRIQESRGPATEWLCRTLAELPRPPRVLISASATGIYGNRGDEPLDEASAPGPDGDFLTEVARAWEAGTEPLRAVGTRVVNLRIGIVLTPAGGALGKMLLPFRFGLGGRLGDGHHWMSWITRADLVRAIQHALADERLRGPVLAVSPNPVTNRDFTRALGRALRRPTPFPVPKLLLRLLFGELTSVLLHSQRARPGRLLDTGFVFEQPDLDAALAEMLTST